MKLNEQQYCRLCGGSLKDILNFGETALANSYPLPPAEPDEDKAPLIVCQCSNCGSAQLRYNVDSETLFSNYLYESSTSQVLINHFTKYAKDVFDIYLKKDDLVVDIGSNDSIGLKPFKALGCKVVGVEPAKNIVDKQFGSGIPIYNDFFDERSAFLIGVSYGKAQVITCNNCFAHVSDLNPIIQGVKVLLDVGGVFIFENAYLLDTIRGLYFDQVYHEHVYYHSLKPLVKFFHANNMEIFDVQRNGNQGGSIRCFVRRGVGPVPKVVYDLIKEEEEAGLYEAATYQSFIERLYQARAELIGTLRDFQDCGMNVCAYGAPAKFTTFAQVFGIDKSLVEFVVEDAKLKIGRLTPGTHLPIVQCSELYKEKAPKVCLITAWNFAESIIEKHHKYLEDGNIFVVPLPEVKTYCLIEKE
jgi:SAM-dependent methyltransferase